MKAGNDPADNELPEGPSEKVSADETAPRAGDNLEDITFSQLRVLVQKRDWWWGETETLAALDSGIATLEAARAKDAGEAKCWKGECLDALKETDATSVGGLIAHLRTEVAELKADNAQLHDELGTRGDGMGKANAEVAELTRQRDEAREALNAIGVLKALSDRNAGEAGDE